MSSRAAGFRGMSAMPMPASTARFNPSELANTSAVAGLTRCVLKRSSTIGLRFRSVRVPNQGPIPQLIDRNQKVRPLKG